MSSNSKASKAINAHHKMHMNESICLEMTSGTKIFSSQVRSVVPDDNDKLRKYYADMLANLQCSIQQKLPAINPEEQQIFINTCQATVAARASRDAAEAAQKAAKTPEEKDATSKALDGAETALAQSIKVGVSVARPMLRKLFVDLDKTDLSDITKDLVLCSVLYRATPQGLSEFVQKGLEEKKLIDALLADDILMKEMLEASGPTKGKYGEAMQIYTSILNHSMARKEPGTTPCINNENEDANNKSKKENVLHRLALGVSLELAEPIHVFDQPHVQIDPLERYLHYEQAYLHNELDEAFSTFSAWEYRFVINSDASSDQLKWGRQMLRNYYPDHIFTTDRKWRYTRAVRTDVPYKHPSWTSTPRTYAQIISGGGECGPRAWFGRFITQTFGIPIWGVRQPGHAALTHWAPSDQGGWVVCLGATWKFCWWNDRWGPDFLLETQARKATATLTSDNVTKPSEEYKDDSIYSSTVLHLEWIANAYGEHELDAMKGIADPGSFWRSLALMQKHILAGDTDVDATHASCDANTDAKEEGSSSSLDTSTMIHSPPTADSQRCLSSVVGIRPGVQETSIQQNGTIIIPAASCSKPLKSTNNFIFMKSFSGGYQIHHLNDEVFEYTIHSNGIPPGKYGLSLKVCTVHADNAKQPLLLTVSSVGNGFHDDGFESLTSIVSITTPYTMGMWDETKPVEIELFDDETGSFDGGRSHLLSFSRETPNLGLTIKEIILTPCSSSGNDRDSL